MGGTLFNSNPKWVFYFRAVIGKLESRALLVYSFLSTHDFSQYTLVCWVKHSPDMNPAVNTRETVLEG